MEGMADPASPEALLRALGRLARGLTTLFWGLPVALVVLVKTATKTSAELEYFDFIPPVAVCAWLVYGIWQLGAFRPSERVWQRTLDKSRILSLVCLGLSPFLYFWVRFPSQSYFFWQVVGLAISGILLLAALNAALRRLVAMLPDQMLRQEVRLFTSLNLGLLAGFPLAGLLLMLLLRLGYLPGAVRDFLVQVELVNPWMMVFLCLIPLSMTMALLWKIRETVHAAIFSREAI
jgi:hypothetical protein